MISKARSGEIGGTAHNLLDSRVYGEARSSSFIPDVDGEPLASDWRNRHLSLAAAAFVQSAVSAPGAEL